MATLPTLPQATVDTTYSLPTGGTTHVCDTAAEFTTALTNAALGDVIELAAGTTFAAPTNGFNLPNKTGTGWIYIVSSNVANLPAGTRVAPGDAADMAKITCTSTVNPCVQAANGAHHYRFVGIEFTVGNSSFVSQLINLGGGVTSVSNMPHHITFDRCYIHAHATLGGRRGGAFDGEHIGIVECYISGFREAGADTQAVWFYQGAGPYKIHNCYLEAAGENFMSGGADPLITDAVPSDITFTRNHLYKPASWFGGGWVVKNIFELKNAQRVLVHGCVLENNWANEGQNGYSILFTPRNQDGGATWVRIRDVTIRRNRGINFCQGVNIMGTDDIQTSQQTQRILLEDNEFTVNAYLSTVGNAFQVSNAGADITIRHNTIFCQTTHMVFTGSVWGKTDQFVYQDNVIDNGEYGLFGDEGLGSGTTALNAFCTNWTWEDNAIIAGSSTGYPTGNYFPANNAAVGFTDYAGGDYSLTAQSTYHNAGSDGQDIGADIAAINAAIAGTDSNLAGPANVRWRPA